VLLAYKQMYNLKNELNNYFQNLDSRSLYNNENSVPFIDNLKVLISILFLSLSLTIWGQKDYTLDFTNTNYKEIKKNPELKFKDSAQLVNYLKSFRSTAISKGYLLASIDTFFWTKKTLTSNFYLGPKFGKAYLTIDEEDLEFIKRKQHLSEKYFTGIAFRPNEVKKILNELQKTLSATGYPFGKVYLDSVHIEDETLHAHIRIDKYNQVKWTKIHIKGDSSISAIFLTNLIRIKKGDNFSQPELDLIPKRLKQINFLKEIKPHDILFTKEGAELFLYIESNPISSINGVVGLQPDPKTSKLNLTGELSLKLLNVLKRGELLDFKWRSIQAQTQSLKTQLNYPFLFKSSFGVDANFQLYKRDSTFLELKSTLGIQYFLRGGNYIKLFYQANSSNVLSGGKNNPQFTNLGSVNSNNYGLAIFRQRLDYIPNPTKGFLVNAELSAGLRKSRVTDTSSVETSNTYRGQLTLEWYFPLAKRHILKLSNIVESYYAPAIYQNEVYRFGGLNSQRGFNEEELFSTSRSTLNIEYRFLLDQNSRVFLFYDQSWYENNSGNYMKDTPFGFGTGFSFGTNIGIFSISYALGKQFSNPILLRDGKIHFGYIAYF
jgi:outer membrane protein assembly factor BamA